MGTPLSGIPGLDKREDYRARYIADVEIEFGQKKLHGQTTDISLGGANIDVVGPLQPGAQVTLRVPVDEGAPLELACVVRVKVGNSIGVEFIDPKPEARERLRNLLGRLPH